MPQRADGRRRSIMRDCTLLQHAPFREAAHPKGWDDHVEISRHPMAWNPATLLVTDDEHANIHVSPLEILDSWQHTSERDFKFKYRTTFRSTQPLKLEPIRQLISGTPPPVRGPSARPAFRIGDRVVLRDCRLGVVRFIGPLELAKRQLRYRRTELFVGVQLDDAVGEHDGLFRNKRFFSCKPGHGTMCSASTVLRYKPKHALQYVDVEP